jgi:hypothetical protein
MSAMSFPRQPSVALRSISGPPTCPQSRHACGLHPTSAEAARATIGDPQRLGGTHSITEISMSYGRFAAMVATSTIAMFVLMYLNTYQIDHVWFSQTRVWMALVMGATMAVIMLLFMLGMYKSKGTNVGILVGSVVVFAVSLWLVRSQQTVYDVAYMKAMIPHHSIAIMTSERAHIRDPRVRKLADEIIRSQFREIGEMKQLIAELEKNPPPEEAPDLLPYNKDGNAAD